mgnify:FL=1
MKKFCKKGIGVVLAATMATGGMAVYASEATKDGSGAAGISGEAALEEVDGSQFAGEEWYDQRATFQVNREKAHTSFTSFQTVEDAKVRDKSNSPFYQLLSGQWKFEFAENPAGRNTEFYKNDYDVSNWDDITVPANWQTEGYDHPKYTDTRLHGEVWKYRNLVWRL